MCFTSAVMTEFQPYIPVPYRRWNEYRPPYPWKDNTVKLDPTQLQELIDAFHESVKSAEKFDALTGQPDCVDPEKDKLRDRVKELENILNMIKYDIDAS